MKSQQFTTYSCGIRKFSQRDYTRYLANQIHDPVLQPLNHKDEKTIERIEASPNEEIKLPDAVAKTKSPKKPEKMRKYKFTSKNLVQYWDEFPSQMSLIVEFLPHEFRVNLMATCKSLYNVLKTSIWEFYQTKIRLTSGKSCYFEDLEHLRDNTKALQYTVSPAMIYNSQTMFSSSSRETRDLARNLVDFKAISNLSMKIAWNYFSLNLSDQPLMLSIDEKRETVVLWADKSRKGQAKGYILERYHYGNGEEVCSAEFCTDKFIVIQTKKSLLKENAKMQRNSIYIQNVQGLISNFDGSVQSTRNCLYINCHVSEDQTSAENLSHTENEMNYQGIPIDRFSVCYANNGKFIFYMKNQGKFFMMYDTATQKIEGICEDQAFEKILDVIVPNLDDNQTLCYVINTSNQIFSVQTSTDTGFITKEIKYLEESQSSVVNMRKKTYQFGSIKDQNGKIVEEYVILLNNQEFYLVNLYTGSPRKIIDSSKMSGEVIAWHSYDGLIVVVFNNMLLSIYKYSRKDLFWRITKKNQTLITGDSQSPTSTLLKNYFDLERAMVQSSVVMSHSYILFFNFPYVAQSFNVYITFLPELLNSITDLDAKPETNLNTLKSRWEITSEELFHKNPAEYFDRCNNDPYYQERVKFEDNKLLIDLGGFNWFVNLRSSRNYIQRIYRNYLTDATPYLTKTLNIEIPKEYKTEESKADMDNSVPVLKNPQMKLVENMNHLVENPNNLLFKQEECEKKMAMIYQGKVEKGKVKETIADFKKWIPDRMENAKELALRLSNKQKKIKKNAFQRKNEFY